MSRPSLSTAMSATARAGLIAGLRARIAGHETANSRFAQIGTGPRIVRFGAPVMEAMLPGGGLSCAALHEVRAASYRDMGASLNFAAALAIRCAETFPDAPVLWCEAAHAPFDVGRLYGPGLAAFGLDPARLILVTPPSAIDMLWTMEEALRLGAFAAVIGEIDGRISAFNLTATRRLQLAAEKHGHPALLLTGHAADGVSAAVTRWRVASLPSRPDEKISSIGRPRWLLSLERCRGMAADMRLHMHDHAQEVTWDPQQQMFCDPPSAHRTNGNAEATPSLVRAG